MPRLIFFFLSFLYVFLCETGGEKIIINTDAGADDAFAILMLLRYEKSQQNTSELEIIGITCSYGNTLEENVEQNVLKTLTVAKRNDISVFAGAHQGYNEPFTNENYFGSDGFGDFTFNQTITATIDRSKHAAVALVDMAREHAGNVSVLSIGPTTNIGLAIALDRNFTKNVQHFYVMGGSVHGVGNYKPNVEFNFAADPESNLALFNSTEELQITLLPFETAMEVHVSMDWRLNVFGKSDSPYVQFLNEVESVVNRKRGSTWESADSVIAAYVIEKSLVTSHVVTNVDPVTDGKARGSLLIDYKLATDKVKNSFIVDSINATLYQDVLVRYLTCEQLAC